MAGTNRYDLLSNAAAGNGSALEVKSAKYNFIAEATFNAGSVKLQFQTPQLTWIDVPSSSLTANGSVALDLHAGQYRAVAIGGALTGAYAFLTTAVHYDGN
jgi:hypothetical protein